MALLDDCSGLDSILVFGSFQIAPFVVLQRRVFSQALGRICFEWQVAEGSIRLQDSLKTGWPAQGQVSQLRLFL